MIKITEGLFKFYYILIEKTILRFLEILSQSHCIQVSKNIEHQLSGSVIMNSLLKY